MNDQPESAEDKRLFAQVQHVHGKVWERLQALLSDEHTITEMLPDDPVAKPNIFWLGCSSALFYQAVFLDKLRDEPIGLSKKKRREMFIRFAGDCWDDYHGLKHGGKKKRRR